MSGGELTRTALFQNHVEAGAKLVDFHGYELPIWYTSLQDEHLKCRSVAGLFDVSHMGFFRFSGEGVLEWLNGIGTQNFLNIPVGRCGYTHFLDHNGFIIDDMIFAVESESSVLGVPNATMIGTMLNWFTDLLPEDNSIELENLSNETSILALQGPATPAILSDVLGMENVPGRFKCQKISENSHDISGWIQGTGYTGERGVEIFVSDTDAPILWDALLNGGASHGVTPVGLGARDTLRLEKGYLLSGQDFLWPGLEITPDAQLPDGYLARDTAETAVPFGISLEHDFIGRARVESSMKTGARWHGLLTLERGPSPRPGHEVLSSEEENSKLVGYVTSGGPAPSLSRSGIAMAYLEGAKIGDELWIQASPRRRVKVKVVKLPFV